MNIQVAILGATGYTGSELIRLIDAHPVFSIAYLGAHTQAGKKVGEVLPSIHHPLADMVLQPPETDIPDEVELVFAALPHGAAARNVKRALDAGKRVVDLSADFRHNSQEIYQQAYQQEHPHPELFHDAVYGLSEWAKEDISTTALLANPGCYPTSVLLPIIPLIKAGVLDNEHIIVDAKSGTSGAGRSAKTSLLYCEINEGLAAYGLPRHRHTWEMEEWAQGFTGKATRIRFVPHIVPMSRGMLSTLHVTGTSAETWLDILKKAYANAPFVRIMEMGTLPSTKAVAGSNRCDIGIGVLSDTEAVIVSCIDNLLKGASGQALQNANLMFTLDETLGLPIHAQWP